MDNALASPAPTALADLAQSGASAAAPTGFAARMAALPMRSKLSLGVGLAALAGVVLAMTLWSGQGDYRPVFTGLSDKDGGAVIAQLATLNVPYRHEPGGTILVPANQVYDVRMKLASAGLPKGSTVGFELMDKTSIGQTQFNERLNFQRALEGELTRTITALNDVADARVHLAMPQQNGFFREQQKPSASVMLTLRGGRTLDRAQVAGIVHLVSASVPELNPKAVSVLDHTGALLSNAGDNGSGLDSQQLQYKQQIEANYNKRIYELLEPVVGRENLRATVTADVDFSQVESTAEEYKPNQGANAQASVRSNQTQESINATPALPTGVPGAATNQPPVPATAPINGQAAPLQTAQGGTNGQQSTRREAVTNYELDKTVRVTRNATGTVRRLNAAVVINHRQVTDAKGKTSSQPVSAEELTKLNELVREAMGFSQDRGDSIKVVSAPFMDNKPEVVDVPLWKQPWLLDLLRTAAVPLALVLVALIAVFGLVRPAIRAANPPPAEAKTDEAGQLNAMVDDQHELPGMGGLPALEAPVSNDKLERARQLARDNPVAVANIMRSWINGEELATT
ncbi:flagellar basal-body MS-ring/collar protein FliF [Paucibacter sp. PLA-PC-4]|uniref:flagellar basal-body MS-ring/collar protein FliF n=1 Tax=Paucibacter sp. PLA-PC-4 TaxID=2993655 RepID=UPI00224AADD2|nr:flagellar basal-body MS-ring/collar protein FliF [Paucibacter sp. PLA-PC-4]MCX2863829.1 flagellar basal-body MS-ring/collar protein FliF [Paucibacter sp. PLA-PC-4]